jgi:hypothetical protein
VKIYLRLRRKCKQTCGSKSNNTLAHSAFSFSSSRRLGGGGTLVPLALPPPPTTPPNRFRGGILFPPPPKAEDTAATLPAKFKSPFSEFALLSDAFKSTERVTKKKRKEKRGRRRTDARYSLQPSPSPKIPLSLSLDPLRRSPTRALPLLPPRGRPLNPEMQSI